VSELVVLVAVVLEPVVVGLVVEEVERVDALLVVEVAVVVWPVVTVARVVLWLCDPGECGLDP
jgi:hypothetical protein